jgi:hypothetical protein
LFLALITTIFSFPLLPHFISTEMLKYSIWMIRCCVEAEQGEGKGGQRKKALDPSALRYLLAGLLALGPACHWLTAVKFGWLGVWLAPERQGGDVWSTWVLSVSPLRCPYSLMGWDFVEKTCSRKSNETCWFTVMGGDG